MSDLLDKVRLVWKIDQLLPEPIGALLCPVCRSRDTHIRGWKHHDREESSYPPRCDVMLKCYDCSMAWCHGVPVPERETRMYIMGETIDAAGDTEETLTRAARNVTARLAENLAKA